MSEETARRPGKSRLVYDKQKRTIVTIPDMQAELARLRAENARLVEALDRYRYALSLAIMHFTNHKH